jgi:uncharacterized membrane protein
MIAGGTPMLDLAGVARVVHVLSIVHWIGGLMVVTTIILPQAHRMQTPELSLDVFEGFERRFAAQARWSIGLAGLSGYYMLGQTYSWRYVLEPSLWWIQLMMAIWTVFALMLFIVEPLFLHEAFRRYVLNAPKRAFTVAIAVHAFALMASLLAIGAGVLGAHGLIV